MSPKHAPSTFDIEAHEPLKETARRLARHERTILDWAKAGILPMPAKFNNRNYFPKGVQPRRAG